jgi:hypothetical protein
MKLEFFRQIFEKYSNIKFYGNPYCGSRVFLFGRTDTDGRRDRNDEANSRFSQLRERAKQPINFSPTHTRTNMYLIKGTGVRRLPCYAEATLCEDGKLLHLFVCIDICLTSLSSFLNYGNFMFYIIFKTTRTHKF